MEALIAPVASENIKLTEEFNDANLKIQQLRSQILDITTQNRNKIKETKNWILGELETINSSIGILDTGFKGLTSLQIQAKAKTKTGNSSDSNTNTETMTTQTPKHESSSSAPPLPPSSPPSPPKSSQHYHNEIRHQIPKIWIS